MDLIERLRKDSIEQLFKMGTFSKTFPIWRPLIKRKLGSQLTYSGVLGLGDSLRALFKSTGRPGRSQGDVSGGGAAWEGLVCWYLNLCLINSRTVVIKHSKKLIPPCIAAGITVNYGTFVSNTESDLIAIVFPNKPEFTRNEIPESSKEYIGELNALCEKYFDKIEIGIIQCKTNWNDNAQIPMLWEIVYSSSGFNNRNIRIGSNGFTMKDLKNFSYSFVTAPSQNVPVKAGSTQVQRVNNLSGGNYWGKQSESGVASSIKEIFNKNFSAGFQRSHQRDLESALEKFGPKYSYFQL